MTIKEQFAALRREHVADCRSLPLPEWDRPSCDCGATAHNAEVAALEAEVAALLKAERDNGDALARAIRNLGYEPLELDAHDALRAK